ncbi:MAG: SpoIID/LytB domain-containing protein [Lachnospiraceae bacterium]
MKKLLLLIIAMIGIPCMLCIGYSLLNPEIQIGQGENSIENHRLGKEILLEMNGLYKSMDVEEYVVGVLAGTIPADYDMETLKVQAVLVRTNILKEMQEKNTKDAADLSYQYLTAEERKAIWGERNYDKYENRIESAVVQTAGKVLKKEDTLIMALYHEVSIGKTASAREILDEDISYLQSVESSQDVEAKHYMNIISYTWEEIKQLIQSGQDTQEETKLAVAIEESTENGFVKKLSVGGNTYTGQEAMDFFGLSSTNFYVEEIEGGVRFVCLGKGNCMGVSQYGANYMALNGKTMEEIIKYYYQGVTLTDYK